MNKLPHTLIHAYQALLSSAVRLMFGGGCRYQPTCSEYAHDAVEKHGTFAGSWLTLRRLSRCHPFGGSGFDPVPERTA